MVAEEGWVSVDEALTNLNFADLRCEHDGNVDRHCFEERFDSMDANGDGTISVIEAASVAEERNCFNLTRADIKAGLALASQWFPEDASTWVTNEALLVDLTFHNVVPSEDTPRPHDPLEGVPLPRSLRRPATQPLGQNATAMDTSDAQECFDARKEIFLKVLELFLQILGFDLAPSQNLVDAILQGSSEFAQAVRSIFSYMDAMPAPMDIAQGVWGIFSALFDEGVFLQALRDVVSRMSWWRRAITLIRIAATILLWIASAGAAQILQIVMMGVTIADLTKAFRDEREECSSNSSSSSMVNAAR